MKVLRKVEDHQGVDALTRAMQDFIRKHPEGTSRVDLGILIGSALRTAIGRDLHPQELMTNNLRAWETGFKRGLENI